MRVAAIQMSSTADKSQNLAEAHRLMLEALDRKVDLVAFPENFSLMTDDREQTLAEAETLKGVVVESLQEWAAEYDLWILGGSIPMKIKGDPEHVTNTSLFISPDGEVVARYDKIHLFDAKVSGDREYRESDTVKPGKKPVVFETPMGKAGFSICYDLRFPELYRSLSANGVDVMFAPSAFTAATGKAHWDTLTRARAIENQAYLVAPAQCGSHPSAKDGRARETHGHSRIVDPWGRIIAERPAGPGIVWADINLEHVDRIRADLPALQHRKL